MATFWRDYKNYIERPQAYQLHLDYGDSVDDFLWEQGVFQNEGCGAYIDNTNVRTIGFYSSSQLSEHIMEFFSSSGTSTRVNIRLDLPIEVRSFKMKFSGNRQLLVTFNFQRRTATIVNNLSYYDNDVIQYAGPNSSYSGWAIELYIWPYEQEISYEIDVGFLYLYHSRHILLQKLGTLTHPRDFATHTNQKNIETDPTVMDTIFQKYIQYPGFAAGGLQVSGWSNKNDTQNQYEEDDGYGFKENNTNKFRWEDFKLNDASLWDAPFTNGVKAYDGLRYLYAEADYRSDLGLCIRFGYKLRTASPQYSPTWETDWYPISKIKHIYMLYKNGLDSQDIWFDPIMQAVYPSKPAMTWKITSQDYLVNYTAEDAMSCCFEFDWNQFGNDQGWDGYDSIIDTENGLIGRYFTRISTTDDNYERLKSNIFIKRLYATGSDGQVVTWNQGYMTFNFYCYYGLTYFLWGSRSDLRSWKDSDLFDHTTFKSNWVSCPSSFTTTTYTLGGKLELNIDCAFGSFDNFNFLLNYNYQKALNQDNRDMSYTMCEGPYYKPKKYWYKKDLATIAEDWDQPSNTDYYCSPVWKIRNGTIPTNINQLDNGGYYEASEIITAFPYNFTTDVPSLKNTLTLTEYQDLADTIEQIDRGGYSYGNEKRKWAILFEPGALNFRSVCSDNDSPYGTLYRNYTDATAPCMARYTSTWTDLRFYYTANNSSFWPMGVTCQRNSTVTTKTENSLICNGVFDILIELTDDA